MILLARHGQSATNAQGLLVGRSDAPLTELGERQARALAPLLAGVAEVWTSPLARARETAALCAPGIEASVRDEFVEVDYGELEGRPLTALTGDAWGALESDHGAGLGGGESLASVDARVHAELDALAADRDGALYDPDRHLLVVSHASPIKSAVVWALGVPGPTSWRLRLSNGSLTTIGARRTSPVLVAYNVVPALT